MKANSIFLTAITTMAMAVTLLCGCRDSRVYDHYEPVSDEGWGRNDTVRFSVSRQFRGDYDVSLGLRFNHRYPYRDLSLILCYKVLPSGRTLSDTVLVHVFNAEGQPGGSVGITSSSISYRVRQLNLQEGDSLYVTVRHNMRNDQLPGISDVGLQLAKEGGE